MFKKMAHYDITWFAASKRNITTNETDNDLEHSSHVTVLVPVSSTVIPIPAYKVGFGVGVNGADKKSTKPDEPTKLITGIF
jgi:hypothetical protein